MGRIQRVVSYAIVCPLVLSIINSFVHHDFLWLTAAVLVSICLLCIIVYREDFSSREPSTRLVVLAGLLTIGLLLFT
ncbi:MAG: hypothetical protein II612_03275 [Prevotella sp.]|nr:hypothetical protein [Prevotella sp.]